MMEEGSWKEAGAEGLNFRVSELNERRNEVSQGGANNGLLTLASNRFWGVF